MTRGGTGTTCTNHTRHVFIAIQTQIDRVCLQATCSVREMASHAAFTSTCNLGRSCRNHEKRKELYCTDEERKSDPMLQNPYFLCFSVTMIHFSLHIYLEVDSRRFASVIARQKKRKKKEEQSTPSYLHAYVHEPSPATEVAVRPLLCSRL